MKSLLLVRAAFALAAVGLVVPTQMLTAADPVAITSRSQVPKVGDVELGQGGSLHGTIVDEQGRPLSAARLSVWRHGRVQGQVQSDARGAFAFSGLRGGVYQVVSPKGATLVRAWAHDTAPPSASQALVIAPTDEVIRGQQRISDVFRSDAFIVTSIIAAAIAIPVIVHNSRDRGSDRDDDSSS
jgi:hypothetical protein